jgi:hypothetical protein
MIKKVEVVEEEFDSKYDVKLTLDSMSTEPTVLTAVETNSADHFAVGPSKAVVAELHS